MSRMGQLDIVTLPVKNLLWQAIRFAEVVGRTWLSMLSGAT